MDEGPVPNPVWLEHPRAPSAKERALLDFLLAGPLGKAELLRAQAETARVVGGCACGCSSVHLAVDESAPRAKFTPEETPTGRVDVALIAASQRKARGTTDVVLHVLDGRLAELEIYAGSGVRPRVDLAKLEYETNGA